MSSIEFVSFPGPNDKGGVGPTISFVVNNVLRRDASWVYFADGMWQRIGCDQPLAVCNPEQIDGHRRYVYEFLWPLLIGQPQLARYSSSEHEAYNAINQQLTELLPTTSAIRYVNDHELSIPADLRIWHGPMPGDVPAQYTQFFTPFAENLLRTRTMVFHTRVFMENLLQYVEKHSNGKYRIDRSANTISRKSDGATTHLFAFPLGIDTQYWIDATKKMCPLPLETTEDKKVIFLVGRCDPAKAWESSLEAVERFLHRNKDRHNVLIVIQCGRIFEGLALYDNLWEEVQRRRRRLENSFGDRVVFIDNHLSHEELAALYRRTDVMLVAPWQDGQPLTAKEFVICQDKNNPGILLLSAGAGVWYEFREGALEVNPANPSDIADTIADALIRGQAERRQFMRSMKSKVLANDLHRWWHNASSYAQRHYT